MTIGYFAPAPPARTGVADYAAALAGELQRFDNVRWNDDRADVLLYHLGNNHLHRPMFERALQRPGVIVLHDAVLHHFFLGALGEEQYVREFAYNYGDWQVDLARRLWRNRARSGVDAQYFRYPMLRRIVERSTAVIVHNAVAARMVREHVATAHVVEIPHLYVAPPEPPGYEVVRLRRRLGVAAGTFLFGVFGHLRESKRLSAILRTLDRVRRAGADVALLVAGEFASSDLARNLEPLLRTPGVIRIGYLPDDAFWMHAAAVDACINLRYPTAGETSGIAIRLMGAGKPVLMTAGEESSAIPDAALIRIDHGLAEEAMLASMMQWLVERPADAREIGARGRRHVRDYHDPSRVAAAVSQCTLKRAPLIGRRSSVQRSNSCLKIKPMSQPFGIRTLGRTGLAVGPVGLASGYGAPGDAVEYAFEHGANYFYWGSIRRDRFADGLRRLMPQRDRFVLVIQSYSRLASLVGWSLERALKRIGADYADVLLLGLWNRMPPDRIVDACRAVQHRGLVHYLALSTHRRPLVPDLAARSPFDVFHLRYNAVHRGAEHEIFTSLPKENGPGVVSFTATCWRQLLDPKRTPPGERTPSATDCYRFVLTNPAVHVCMAGPSNRAQADEAVRAAELGPMSNDELDWMRRVGAHIYGRNPQQRAASRFDVIN